MQKTNVVIIGLGLRGLYISSYFKTSDFTPNNLILLEKDSTIGCGILKDYDETTNSIKAKFFKDINLNGVLACLKHENSFLEALKDRTNPNTSKLCRELNSIGGILKQKIPRNCLLLNTEVYSISQEKYSQNLILRMTNEKCISARAVVLCTGRKEQLKSDIFSDKRLDVKMSSYILSRIFRFQNSHIEKISIFGGSHSAFSVLTKIRSCPIFSNTEVAIYHRNTINMYFRNIEEAEKIEICLGRKVFNEKTDICPTTGTVCRDTGIRGAGKKALLRCFQNQDNMTSLVKVLEIKNAITKDMLSPRHLVVQALGFVPNGPKLIDENSEDFVLNDCRKTPSSELVTPKGQTVKNIFLVRIHPTPQAERNNKTDGQRNYRDIAENIRHVYTR